ncbi:MAG: ABC transporter ATP-binding protein [Planctomycetes bacterium]|nr:ABC transporter ATP-binding protein [Planctomycetota bacterium]
MHSETTNNPTPLLRATGITKSYKMGRGSLQVLKGLDFELQRAEVCAVMGSSGSGKSTLLQILGLMDSCDSGSIELNTKEIAKLNAKQSAMLRAKQLGFVFQQFHLIHELSALENVLLPRRVACGMSWFSSRQAEYHSARQLLDEVGLGERINHRPNQLSGGEQQRVAIARALISSPPLILADEPTGNLDSQTGDRILDLLLTMTRERNTSILLATHDAAVAAKCDRTIHLSDGQILN